MENTRGGRYEGSRGMTLKGYAGIQNQGRHSSDTSSAAMSGEGRGATSSQ